MIAGTATMTAIFAISAGWNSMPIFSQRFAPLCVIPKKCTMSIRIAAAE